MPAAQCAGIVGGACASCHQGSGNAPTHNPHKKLPRSGAMDFSSPARRGTAPVRTLVAQAAALALLLGRAAAQAAPTVYLSDDTTLDYSLTLSYAASVRTSAAAAEYLADLNNDDATRNCKKGGLINNRASALGE